MLDSTPVYFDVAEENSSDEGGITVIQVDKPNMAQKAIYTDTSVTIFFYKPDERKDTDGSYI